MLQSIDRGKIYFYILLFTILISIHNLNFTNIFGNFFKIKHIIVNSDIDSALNQKIYNSLNKFNNKNIISVKSSDFTSTLENFNIIGEYKIIKEYPSIIKINLKKTKILAYYFKNDVKFFIGENGKKIKDFQVSKKNIPLIEGNFDISEFFYLKELISFNGFLLKDFEKIYSLKSNRWDLLYKENTLIKLPTENLEYSISLLAKIIKNKDLSTIKVIDLRVRDQIIFI